MTPCNLLAPDIATICTGIAASMGAILMCAGVKGKRSALKHSRIMLHQPSGAIGGQATDIEITASEIKKIKQELYDIIANHTGKPVDQVAADCDRDFWMTAEESKEYGLVDEVLIQKSKERKEKLKYFFYRCSFFGHHRLCHSLVRSERLSAIVRCEMTDVRY